MSSTPHVCPLCRGEGKRSQNGLQAEICPVCHGERIVWGPPETAPEPVKYVPYPQPYPVPCYPWTVPTYPHYRWDSTSVTIKPDPTMQVWNSIDGKVMA